uniref:Uncharacterized protein n=1 Tax=Lepeophtheirus salmonis TaxID=72036 RepID=A0A0K2T2R5_LEPSM
MDRYISRICSTHQLTNWKGTPRSFYILYIAIEKYRKTFHFECFTKNIPYKFSSPE